MAALGTLASETNGAGKVTGARFRLEIDFLPPSANELDRGKGAVRGRADTGKYRAFKRHFATAALFAIRNKLPPRTPYRVHLRANVNRKRDLDNCIKPLIDGLVNAGLTPKDHWCDEVFAIRDCTVKGVVIEAEAL